MKNILFIIVLLFLIVPWVQINAFDVKVGEDIYITENINNDFYIAGGNINVNTLVNGDLLIAGGKVDIDSDIKQDLFITAGDIKISGNIGDDVRIVGGNVTINSNINGDLFIGAGNIRIEKGVIIGGNLVIGAGRLVMDGEVMGKAKLAVGELIINGTINGDVDIVLKKFTNPFNTGIIKGNLNYKSDNKIQNLEDISKAEVIFEKTFMEENTKKGLIGFITSFIAIKIFGLFLFSSFFYLYLQKFFSDISDNLRIQTGKSFLYGFFTIIGLPIIILLFLFSIIGIPFGLLFLFGYIFIFVFLSLINVIVFTSFFVDKYKFKELYKKLLIIFGLSLVFGLINGICLLAGFFTIGAVIIKKIEIIQSLRN